VAVKCGRLSVAAKCGTVKGTRCAGERGGRARRNGYMAFSPPRVDAR
jgi:hypothetical protein